MMKLKDELNSLLNPRGGMDFETLGESDIPGDAMLQKTGKLLNIGMQMTTQLQVVLMRPSHFDDSNYIANHLIERHTVILNMEGANEKAAASILNFLRGVAYALGANVSKVTNGTYVFTPANVHVKGADLYGEVEAALYSTI